MFADDTYITTSGNDIEGVEQILNKDLEEVDKWLKTNKLSCNSKKTNYMMIGSRQNLEKVNNIDLTMSYQAIERKRCTKLLGLHIDELVLWDDHIQHITSKVSNGLRMQY